MGRLQTHIYMEQKDTDACLLGAAEEQTRACLVGCVGYLKMCVSDPLRSLRCCDLDRRSRSTGGCRAGVLDAEAPECHLAQSFAARACACGQGSPCT